VGYGDLPAKTKKRLSCVPATLADQPIAQIDVEVLACADTLAALRGEWDALTDVASCHASDTWAWAMAGWHCIAAQGDAALRVIVARTDGRLVGLWPLVRYQTWRGAVLRPLGSQATEYASIITEPTRHAEAIALAIWRRAAGLGDALILPHVRAGTLLDLIAGAKARIATRDSTTTRWVDFTPHPDFESFLSTIHHDRLATLRRTRRRLAREGDLAVVAVKDPAERAEVIDWALERKQEWLRENAISNPWIGTDGYRRFLHTLSADARSPLRIFTLRLSGRNIAAAILSQHGMWLESNIVAHDSSWNRFSPGTVLMTETLRFAFEQGVQFDFRIGEQRYKSSWANETCRATTVHAALTMRGLPLVAAEATRLTRLRLRGRLRQARGVLVGHVLKPALRRCGLMSRTGAKTARHA